MNDKNNFIPRHGNPLFYPQDPSEGFQGGSGGLSRRKFLKRTGGATAAAFLAAVPTKLEAHEAGESEEWNMDLFEIGGEFGLVLKSTPVTLVGEHNTLDATLKLRIYSAPTAAPGQARYDTLQITVLSTFSACLEGPGIPTGASTPLAQHEVETDVTCNPANGHLTISDVRVVEEPSNGVPPITTVSYVYDGNKRLISINSGIGSANINDDAHQLVHAAMGRAFLQRFDGNNAPVGPLTTLPPVVQGPNMDGAAAVEITFKSKRVE